MPLGGIYILAHRNLVSVVVEITSSSAVFLHADGDFKKFENFQLAQFSNVKCLCCNV